MRSAVRKPDAEDLLGEPVGVRPDDFNGAGTVTFEGLDGDSGCDAVAGEKNHDLLNTAVLFPRGPYAFEGRFVRFPNLQQPLQLRIDDIEGVQAKSIDNLLSSLGADAADLARAEKTTSPSSVVGATWR